MHVIDPAYPIGRFEAPVTIDAAARERFVAQIEAAPLALRRAVEGLSDRQLDTPYRPGGWNVRQVVHNLPDSHVNAYVRFKLALTENEPTIRTYEEALWAKLPEAASGPIPLSLDLLDALHRRWVACIRALPAASFDRTFRHPELGVMSLNRQLALYAWHGRHHVAHVTTLAAREGWA
ncbi:MAG TPA: putative metal-dependent hydrolase [Thermoanaerobaculia bacterium]|nr:putative metal-dependent hydrolase [Thermoanaerobaculia bacterium]